MASRLLQADVVCSVEFLRLTNIIFAFLTTGLVYLLVEQLHPRSSLAPFTRILNAVAVALFPLQFFFQFLYYTDPGSSFFVLLAYYLLLRRVYFLSSLVSGSLSDPSDGILKIVFFFF